ncbi:MAG: GNAT family N-acetyltransferase [Anaerolineae bacterium]|nr:GNAT family N-acetyltransferase [Anaerolineae bacterium]MDQ7034115.1 GNAT family N-acetyltransferase [Anaerolineae bacterium]
MIGTLLSSKKSDSKSGLRPVNIRTDLAQLADLIELAFRDTMDDNGRAAIREWRTMSSMGTLLGFLGRFNELALGIGSGYVWLEDNRIVGNVSIYPARWSRQVGKAWLIANVSVHPDYQRRGIARQLMQASLDMIRGKGGQQAILQVDYDNDAALNLYDNMGFIRERAFTTWSRSAILSSPLAHDIDNTFITHPRRSDWQAEYALAQSQRPNMKGGIGWLKPVHQGLFQPSILDSILRSLSFNSTERLIIRADDSQQIAATLWIEKGVTMISTRLVLMVDSKHFVPYAEILLNSALRRFRTTSMMIEHPHDDEQATDLLKRYRFRPQRTLWHMRTEL